MLTSLRLARIRGLRFKRVVESGDLDGTISLGSHPENSGKVVVAKEAVKISRTMADQ